MPKNFTHTFFTICLLSVALPVAGSERLEEIVGEFEVFFRELVADRNYPGAAFVIVSRDQVLHISTYGHTSAAKTREVNEQTIFRLASVSKTFAAEIVGLLVEDGTMDWHPSRKLRNSRRDTGTPLFRRLSKNGKNMSATP